MKNNIISRFAIIGIMSLLTPTCALHAQSLQTLQGEMECGQMLFKQPTSITVEMRNAGTETVNITKVETGCGCTQATYSKDPIEPGTTTLITVVFDAKQLGHFDRVLRVFDSSSDTPSEVLMHGQVVTKIIDYTGEYPHKMGALYTDADALEFDNVNKGQRLVREIHVFNASGQNLTPVMLRLPSYLKAEITPHVLAPKQKGTMRIILNSKDLHDYGLIQSTIYLGKNGADKISSEKEIPVSIVLLPPSLKASGLKRANAPRLSMSASEINLTELQKKSKAKDEIILTNTGRTTLEISKLQLFSPGLQVELGEQKLEPGASTKLRVSAKGKDLRKWRTRPRILMITNDPDNQKVIIEVRR